MEEKINRCQTLAELCELERTHLLNEEEQRLVFERRLQIFQRIHEWREENQKLGIEPAILDFWTPEQRQRFLNEWNDDSYIIEASCGEKRTYDEMMSEEPSTSQVGRGEVDEGDNERPFYIESARQVLLLLLLLLFKTRKFKTNATSYLFSLRMSLPTLKLQVCTNSCTKYFNRFWTKPLAAFCLKIKYISSFIPINWINPFIFHSCQPNV